MNFKQFRTEARRIINTPKPFKDYTSIELADLEKRIAVKQQNIRTPNYDPDEFEFIRAKAEAKRKGLLPVENRQKSLDFGIRDNNKKE